MSLLTIELISSLGNNRCKAGDGLHKRDEPPSKNALFLVQKVNKNQKTIPAGFSVLLLLRRLIMMILPSQPALAHGTPLVPMETDLWNLNPPLIGSTSFSDNDTSDKGCEIIIKS